jgi:hypothetical protein
MNITSEVLKIIEETLKGFVANPEPYLIKFDEPLDLRKLAAELNVLPLFLDFGGCYGIHPNGEIVSFYWDEPYKVEVENDPRIRNIVLFQGANKYPELEVLLPARLSDAVECLDCKGTGIFQGLAEHGIVPQNIVCYCGGIGWLPQAKQ